MNIFEISHALKIVLIFLTAKLVHEINKFEEFEETLGMIRLHK